MKKRTYAKKRFAALLIAFAAAAGSILAPVHGAQAEAASKAYMKKAYVKWDLKKNKTISYKTKLDKIGTKKSNIKITKYKIKNSKKKGYKELNYTVRAYYTPLTAKNVHKLPSGIYTAPILNCYTAVVDYNTGKALTKGNKQKVTVKYSGWKVPTNKRKIYRDSDGCIIEQGLYSEIQVKVTYPKKYKGLCIGVGGHTSVNDTKNDTKFWNGKAVFGKTAYYSKKDKSYAHFMRVTK